MEVNPLELIRRIEEEFSIYLPEDELREIYTVGNLYNLLLRLLKPTPDCFTSKAFYRVRRALISALNIPRSSIRPSTFLDELFDGKRIRQQWRAAANDSGLQFPRLRYTAMWKHWMQALSAVLSIGICLTSYKLLSRFSAIRLDSSDSHNLVVWGAFWLAGFILYAVLYPALLKATSYRRSVLPTMTAGELARVVLSMNSGEFTKIEAGSSALTRDKVWIRLVSVFCDMGFRPDDIVLSATIIVDLVDA